jgi:hypothetical protein
MLKRLLFIVLTTVPAAAAEPDSDTVCATLYTYLGESARLAGMSSDFFDTAAIKAETTHLVRNPTEERNRYSLQVIDGVQTIRDGLERGTISTNTVMTTATSCNSRYFPDAASAGRMPRSGDQQTAR